VLRVIFPVVIGRCLEQLPDLELAAAQGPLGLDPPRDIPGDAAIAEKSAILAIEGRAARTDPDDFAVRQLPKIDEVAVGLPRLERRKVRPSRLGLDDDAFGLGHTLADIGGHRQAEDGLDIGREVADAALRIRLPEPVGGHIEELAVAPLAVSQRKSGFDPGGHGLAETTIAAEGAGLDDGRSRDLKPRRRADRFSQLEDEIAERFLRGDGGALRVCCRECAVGGGEVGEARAQDRPPLETGGCLERR
jgi:hypothetical protein